MKNPPITVFLIKLPTAAHNIASSAAREAFPDAQFIVARTVADAAQHTGGAGSRQLLILADPQEIDVGIAAQVADDDDLPRWAVVVLGQSSSDLVEAVPSEEWNVRLLARVFHSAILQHGLVRENLQLRGDLKTVARRINHDMHTPLGCIHLTCELLKETTANNGASIKAMAGVIRESSAEICRLIDRVSYVLKASIDPLPSATVPMGNVVADVLSQLEPEIQQARTTVRHPTHWPKVIGVPQWLEVIWWNLLSNALRHGSPSSPIQIGWSTDNQNERFWVANQCAALPPVQQARLFQRFDHLHTEHAPGLGLSVVRRLVALQGGECGYERLNADSSTFYFTVPAMPASSREPQNASLAQAYRT